MSEFKKIVLAYSGGLDTSVILTWLRETYKADVVAFIADVGQGEETEPARQKALATGACAAYVYDLREEFVRDFVFPAMKANAMYEGCYLLGTSVARPIIAKAKRTQRARRAKLARLFNQGSQHEHIGAVCLRLRGQVCQHG